MLDNIEDDVDISEELADTSDLPTSLIITNVDNNIFSDESQKNQLEEIFQKFDEEASFQYFKSFHRVRVNFTNPTAAANARIQCHQTKIGDSVVNCYFAQPITSTGNKEGETSDSSYLQPPSPVRQFLISPPASPPVGWEPVDEAQPCINYDLLTALAKLQPGEAHELHPPSRTQPGIVVHICEDQNVEGPRLKIVQTRRPDSIDSSSSSSPPSSPTS
ncbi:Calcipressin-3 like protein [Argiope bruennichi]|uniref:Calcipressin-3 like protein n=1 Tax=Argiope bruennichi TaxID=94029 RepID=A0A8T0F4I0_ARGBR|nr:Calcipressin-3 like protein [Argiope bruennichi]